MLRNIYAPTNFHSEDKDPGKTREEKLAIIKTKAVTARQIVRPSIPPSVLLELPFLEGLKYTLDRPRENTPTIHIREIDLGDEELYRQGLGTRLVRAAVRHGLELRPDLAQLTVGDARLGLVNTVIGVFGEENVGVTVGQTYGNGSELPLEAIFDDHPPHPGMPYKVESIRAAIDPHLAAAWELPIDVV
jgi:hypothetical protein